MTNRRARAHSLDVAFRSKKDSVHRGEPALAVAKYVLHPIWDSEGSPLCSK